MLLRCSSADPPDSTSVLDANLVTMLSLQWVQQKLGLDSVILRTTADFASRLQCNTYHPLHYTHSGNSDANLCKRSAVVTSVSVQRDEVRFAERDYSQDIAPARLPQTVLQTSRDDPQYQAVSDFITRRVLHTLCATCVWCHAAFCSVACNVPFSPSIRQAGVLNDSPHAVLHYGDVQRVFSSWECPDEILYTWFWVPDALTTSFSAAFPDHQLLGCIRGGQRPPPWVFCPCGGGAGNYQCAIYTPGADVS